MGQLSDMTNHQVQVGTIILIPIIEPSQEMEPVKNI